jgi:hypothetical protein
MREPDKRPFTIVADDIVVGSKARRAIAQGGSPWSIRGGSESCLRSLRARRSHSILPNWLEPRSARMKSLMD